MAHHEIEQRLKEIYARFRCELNLPVELERKLSAPLLLSIPEQWAASRYRLLVIGKETRGWADFQQENVNTVNTCEKFVRVPDSVEALIKDYANFNFGELLANTRRSPFWRAYKMLGRVLEGNAIGSVLWSNLFRMDFDGESVVKKATQREIQNIYQATSQILADEIVTLAPKAVIFFTGPSYDSSIRNYFPGSELECMSDCPPGLLLSRVAHSSLPPKHCYRTYHPGYMNRKGLLSAGIEKLCELVAQN